MDFSPTGAPPSTIYGPNYQVASNDINGVSSGMPVEEIQSGITADIANSKSAALTPESIDALLARELNSLTFQEREGIHEEIHGVHYLSVDETHDFVEQKLAALEREVQSIPDKPAYDEAVRLNSGYIRDVDRFLLPFLRAELFQEQRAAKRMIKFLAFVRGLYGQVALMRPLYLSDMSGVDRKMLNVGAFQLLPGRDRSGRRIFGIFDDIPPEFPVMTRMRVSLYILMAAAEDVETQKRGVVGIIYQMNPNALVFTDSQERAYVLRLLECIPLRFGAVHFCVPDNPLSNTLKAFALVALGSNRRARARFHSGSGTECQYGLQSFGIPSQQVPINTNSGARKTKQHLKWLELRRRKENGIQSGTTFDGIECPEHKDVLFGRGRPIMRHPGNVVFRNILDARFDEYNRASTKKEKTKIAWEVVEQIKSWSWRFLREDPNGWWVEVSNDVARQKVSIGFRDLRKTKYDDHDGAMPTPSIGQDEMQQLTAATRDISDENVKKRVKGKEQSKDSSTTVFLGLDGRKRQRSCQNCISPRDEM